ncbi:MAG: hypothetical protein EAY69_11955 [Cytophagales bacterium]|nr:MAG: hypothetical protein EAY69_11955 [Cytophagales bacterium]
MEKESSFGLDWTETDHRSYDGEVGRFWQVDKLADNFDSSTPYNYAFNNPILLNDPEGLAPPNFEEFLSGLFAASKNGDRYSGKEVRSAFAKTQGIEKDQEVTFEGGKQGTWMDISPSTKNNGSDIFGLDDYSLVEGSVVNGNKSVFLKHKEWKEKTEIGDYVDAPNSWLGYLFGSERTHQDFFSHRAFKVDGLGMASEEFNPYMMIGHAPDFGFSKGLHAVTSAARYFGKNLQAVKKYGGYITVDKNKTIVSTIEHIFRTDHGFSAKMTEKQIQRYLDLIIDVSLTGTKNPSSKYIEKRYKSGTIWVDIVNGKINNAGINR